jgi:hypothetical protein
MAGALLGIAPGVASASTCVSLTGFQPPNPGTSRNHLSSVAVLSSCNAWAVGSYSNGTADRTLILHWNGTAWTKVASPNPGGSANHNILTSVAAVSGSNAWAVGFYNNGTTNRTLILNWNGSAWTQVASPNPSPFGGNGLSGVDAFSAHNIWAVGSYGAGVPFEATLAVHCC